MTDTFNVIKNVNESFSIYLPSAFVENSTNVFRLSGNIDISATPSLATESSAVIDLTGSIAVTSTLDRPYTNSINMISKDYRIVTNSNLFVTTAHTSINLGKSGRGSYKTWIPFTVSGISSGTTITSAYLGMTAISAGTNSGIKYYFGCDNQDNPAAPNSYADLNSRVMTPGYSSYLYGNNLVQGSGMFQIPTTAIGHNYLFDVTTAVQSIVSQGWVNSAHTLAILLINNGSTGTNTLKFASYENTTYGTPINVTGMSYSARTVTLTAANTFSVGNRINVAGVNAGYTVTNIDGDWIAANGTNSTQVVFQVTTTPTGTTPQTSSHGTVTKNSLPTLFITI